MTTITSLLIQNVKSTDTGMGLNSEQMHICIICICVIYWGQRGSTHFHKMMVVDVQKIVHREAFNKIYQSITCRLSSSMLVVVVGTKLLRLKTQTTCCVCCFLSWQQIMTMTIRCQRANNGRKPNTTKHNVTFPWN